MTNRGQQIDGVPSEAADGLGQHDVDFSCLTVSDQALELRTRRGAGAGDPGVHVHARVFPAGHVLDESAVVADLG